MWLPPVEVRTRRPARKGIEIQRGLGPGGPWAEAQRQLFVDRYPAVRAALDAAGVALWGWHVPFCATHAATTNEAAKVIDWATQYNLAGVLLDAERTPDHPRFQGDDDDARLYAGTVHASLTAAGRGVALSSHDQPAVHRDFPFAIFLENVDDNSPQVYYRVAAVATRLNKSIRDYTPLEAARDFKDRYKPTGNITMGDDLPLPDVRTCLAATKNFIKLVHTKGYRGYSFWCSDTAPDEIGRYSRRHLCEGRARRPTRCPATAIALGM